MGARRAAAPPVSEVLRARLGAQGLAGPPLGRGAAGPVAVARRLLATQAQDSRGFRLAIRARTEQTSAADVDGAIGEERSLLVTWLNRGTLQLATREDYPLLQALASPGQRTANATRLAGLGIGPDLAGRAVGLVDRWLAEDGPLSREVLRARLLAAGVAADGQALVHILFRASLEGVLVRGPVGSGSLEQRYVRVADWMPEAPAAVATVRDRPDAGLREIARRYLEGHGPADPRDLARWLGVPLRDVRPALRALGSRLVAREDGLVALAAAAGPPPEEPPLPAPRLLGAFEPLLVGWRSREEVLGVHEPRVISGGVFRGFALVGGRAAAGWRLSAGRVSIEPFGALPAGVARALERDGQAVLRYLGR